VALVLAVGLVVAVNTFTAAMLYDALFSAGPGLSENATQILSGAFGGIIGVLGSFIGYRASMARSEAEQASDVAPAPAPPATRPTSPSPVQGSPP
jgi:hypothetical protein